MGTEKRERQKANRAARQAAEEAAEARRRRIRLIRNAVILTVVIVIALFLLNGCGSSSGDDTAAGTSQADTSPNGYQDEPGGSTTPAGAATTVPTAPAKAGYGTTPCPPAAGEAGPVLTFTDSFQQCIDPAKTYEAVVETTEGTVTFTLDAAGHPVTTNNFVALARSHYYDGTDLFRTEASSGIIQGGSPHTQSNTDPGPGYTIADEGPVATAADYGPGTLAMARTSAPDSASAQFFFLSNEGGRYLADPAAVGDGAGSYRAFGTVTTGLDVLVKIAQLDNGMGAPTTPASIKTVTIVEK